VSAILPADKFIIWRAADGKHYGVTAQDMADTFGGGGAGGSTNLSAVAGATDVTITSDTGIDAVIPLATSALAGVMDPADKIKADFIAVTQAVDLDAMEDDVADLVTLTGRPANAVDLGTFPGGVTIPNASTIKAALVALDNAAHDAITLGGTAATNPLTLTTQVLDFDISQLTSVP
jgi:hypothetical protein